MRKYVVFSVLLLLAIVQGLAGSTSGDSKGVVARPVTATMATIAAAFSDETTTDVTYNYNLSQTMVGGQPAWFRSCTWGEFPVVDGGTGTGSPPLAFIGGDPNLRQAIEVQYWSDLPVDLYFLTRDQELSWFYHTSLWPYQFCAPPLAHEWTYGWENRTYASFTATLPAGTCPCSILIFNMDASEAHLRFVVSGLGISAPAYQHSTAYTLADRYSTGNELHSFGLSSVVFVVLGLALAVAVVFGNWIRRRPN